MKKTRISIEQYSTEIESILLSKKTFVDIEQLKSIYNKLILENYNSLKEFHKYLQHCSYAKMPIEYLEQLEINRMKKNAHIYLISVSNKFAIILGHNEKIEVKIPIKFKIYSNFKKDLYKLRLKYFDTMVYYKKSISSSNGSSNIYGNDTAPIIMRLNNFEDYIDIKNIAEAIIVSNILPIEL